MSYKSYKSAIKDIEQSKDLTPEQSAQKERFSLLNDVISLYLMESIDMCNMNDPEDFREALAYSLTKILTAPTVSKIVSAVNKNEVILARKYAEKQAMIRELIKAPALIEPIEETPFYKFTNYADHIEIRSRIGSFESLFNADIMRYKKKGQILSYANLKSLYTALNNRPTFKNHKTAHKDNQN